MFHGFSKVLIGLGLEPAEMETTVYPTPDFETPTPDVSLDDPHVAVLTEIPDLAARWALTYRELWRTGNVTPDLLEACRVRIAELLRVEWARKAETVVAADEPGLEPARCAAELFVMDARGIDESLRSSLREALGDAGLLTLFVGFALWDGIYRVDRTLALSSD